MIPRTDFLSTKKGVHIEVGKETYLALRQLMFTHEVSIQGLFQEFARMLVQGDSRALKILEAFVVKRAGVKLEARTQSKQRIHKRTGKKLSTSAKRPNRGTNLAQEKSDDLDHNVLYSLIEEKKEESDEDP